ncbi:MAG: Mut7-C RNAse domain-containing protein [Candidatus Nezhaarchaeales archaeon]
MGLGGARLLVDSMCGRLTRWLRMLGIDAAYLKDGGDEELLNRAKDEGRVLVTRDEGLYERALREGVSAILLKSHRLVEQLAHVASRLDCKLEIVPEYSRCPNCNSLLRRAPREEVSGLVPEGSLRAHKEFWICTGCAKVYWRGRHFVNIERVLNKVREAILRLGAAVHGEGAEA